MIKLIIIILIIGTLLVCGYFVYNFLIKKADEIKKEYQGPVPEGYNETHFRETGETIPLGGNE